MTTDVVWIGRYGTAKVIALVFVFFCILAMGRAERAFAATGSGTVISNTATITFSDANSNGFLATSNTVLTTVQNAPSLTITAPVGQFISPGMFVVDTFNLMNTGNASGGFMVPADAIFSGTASGTTLVGYVLNGLLIGTCSVASPCPYATLNTQSGMSAGVGLGGTITVGVEYSAPTGAISPQTAPTVQTTLSVSASYASVTGGAAELSPPASATETDTEKPDARLDVQATATMVSGTTPSIAWTITANNGGGFPAQGLASAKALFGANNNGIAIFVPMPSFAGQYLQMQAAAIPVLNGATAGTIPTVYYNTSPCTANPTQYWTLTFSQSAECVAVYLANTTSTSNGTIVNLLPSASAQSTGAGGVTTAQITFSFSTNQPTALGASAANSVTMIANSAIGGNSWATFAVPIIGPGVTLPTTGTSLDIDAANASLLNAVQANVTAGSGTTPPGGASNQAGSQAAAQFGVLNGPYGVPSATGWYPGALGTGPADNMHDFTALGVPCTSNGGSGLSGTACTVGTNNIVFNSLQNTGSLTDTIQLTATAPAGWTVQLFNVGACTAGGGAVWPSCPQGLQITGVSGTGAAVSAVLPPMAPSATLNYEAVYIATNNSATPFTSYTAKITATGQSGNGLGTDTNDTYNTLYPGSVILTTTAVTVTTSGCPPNVTPANAGACPGGTLTYSLNYANVVPASVGGANLGSEPMFAYSALSSSPGSAILTDDGTPSASNTNNWATYTTGIAAPALDSLPAPGTGTVFTYYTATGPTTTFPGATKLTAQIGGNSYQIGPGASGAVTFTVVVK